MKRGYMRGGSIYIYIHIHIHTLIYIYIYIHIYIYMFFIFMHNAYLLWGQQSRNRICLGLVRAPGFGSHLSDISYIAKHDTEVCSLLTVLCEALGRAHSTPTPM